MKACECCGRRLPAYVEITGGIWMPYGMKAATVHRLTDYDVENMQDDNGNITRESVDRWVGLNSGDFSSVDGWSAMVEGMEFPFEDEEVELQFNHCMYGDED